MASLPGKAAAVTLKVKAKEKEAKDWRESNRPARVVWRGPLFPSRAVPAGGRAERRWGTRGDEGRARRPHGHGDGMVPAALPGSVPGGG